MTRDGWWLAPAGIFLFVLPFTHTVALRLIALFAAFGLAAWQWWPARTPTLPRSLPAWRWIAFWAALPLVLAATSRDPAYSLGEWKTEVLYGMLALTTFFVTVRGERRLKWALWVLFCAFLVLSLWALGARLHYGYWDDARRFGGTGTFSTYLVTLLPLVALIGPVRLIGRSTTAVVSLVLVLAGGVGYLTEQRGLWVAFAAQLVALAIVFRIVGSWRPQPMLFWSTLIVIMVMGSGVMLLAVSQRFGAGLDLGVLVAGDPRLANWFQVLERIAQAPMTGHGFGRGMMAKAFPEMWGRSDMFWHAHNMVLDYGIQLGVPGLIAILGVFGALLVHWMRLARSSDALVRAIGITGTLLVVGVFTRNMTNDFFQRDLSLLFWALTGMLAGVAHARGAGR